MYFKIFLQIAKKMIRIIKIQSDLLRSPSLKNLNHNFKIYFNSVKSFSSTNKMVDSIQNDYSKYQV